MLFSSVTFIYFFIPVLLIFYFIWNNNLYRRIVLTVFSLLFYAWGEPIYILLMLGTVFVNYIAGLFIGKAEGNAGDNTPVNKVKKRAYLIVAVALNLFILALFKYTSLFVSTANLLPFVSIPVPNIILPLGISFYTFQAMSYMIDVYRGDAPVQRSYFSLLLYVSLFPQLIAGPIVRYKDIESQLSDRHIDVEAFFEGVYRFSIGLSKKVLLANNCGAAAETLLNMRDSDRAVLGLWVGILFFALQIYFDFSGYSDMAIGLGMMFGFRFRENFDYPYISKSATEFWRRWHISLGTFFRDYVYIPLGGNRKYWLRNVLIVWFLTGLWHGASWNFVLWGCFYAALLILEKKALFGLFKKLPKAVGTVVSYIYMFFVTLIGWMIFYCTDFSVLCKNLSGMFGSSLPFNDIFVESVIRDNAILLVAAVFFALPFMKILLEKISAFIEKSKPEVLSYIQIPLKTVFISAALFFCTAMLAGDSYNPFLYFRF